MASKRLLKKRMKRIVYEILDECDYVIVSEGSNADKADALIDEAVAFHNDINERISKAENKSAFRGIKEEVDRKEQEFIDKLNKLH